MTNAPQLMTLWTWQHPAWDIRRQGWSPEYMDYAWGSKSGHLTCLYEWLHGILGTGDFVWCYWKYEHWAQFKVRKLWKLQVPPSAVFRIVYRRAWEALVQEKYDSISEEQARERVLCGRDQQDSVPLVRVPVPSEWAEDCGRFNCGTVRLCVPYDELPRCIDDAQAYRKLKYWMPPRKGPRKHD